MIKSIDMFTVESIDVYFTGNGFKNYINLDRIGGGWSVMPNIVVKNAKIVSGAGSV